VKGFPGIFRRAWPLLLAAGAAWIQPGRVSAAPAPSLLATYNRAVLEPQVRADRHRHMDTPATIARLRLLHAGTYFCPVRSSVNWEDLRDEFLPAAAAAGIDVWVYLLPPTESKADAMTFGHDFIRWAAEIARLSQRYPNLKGFSIDDFAYNLSLFTPDYAARMREAARAVNPAIKFYPLLYWKSFGPEFLDTYSPVIDGVIFAYRDEPTVNTSRVGAIRSQLSATERMLAARGQPLVLMVYCWPLDRIPIPPGVEYVRQIVGLGLDDLRDGTLAGVVTYCLPLDGQPADAAQNYAHGGNGRATLLASGVKVPVGSFGEVSCSAVPGTGPRRLGFWQTATSQKLSPGCCYLQVLADDAVVWERDAAIGPAKVWQHETVELGAVMAGSQPRVLRFRLAVKGAAPSLVVTGGFDDLEPEGFTVADPGFEAASGWQLRQNHPALMPTVQTFDPGRPVQMFEAVRELYGRAQRNLADSGSK